MEARRYQSFIHLFILFFFIFGRSVSNSLDIYADFPLVVNICGLLSCYASENSSKMLGTVQDHCSHGILNDRTGAVTGTTAPTKPQSCMSNFIVLYSVLLCPIACGTEKLSSSLVLFLHAFPRGVLIINPLPASSSLISCHWSVECSSVLWVVPMAGVCTTRAFTSPSCLIHTMGVEIQTSGC